MESQAAWILSLLSALRDFEPTTTFWWQIVLLMVLIVLSGFFSGSEIALFRLSRTRRRHLIEEGMESAKVVDILMRHPNRVLITILIGNNLVNIGAASLATVIAIDLFGDRGVGVATGVMTLLVLIFGEITPKAYAARYSQKVALRVGPVLRFLQIVLRPLVWVLERITDAIFRLFGATRHEDRTFMSSDEIRTLIDVGTEEGVLEEEEQEMLHGVISFGELMAKEVMVPRTDMIALEADAPLEQGLQVAIDSGYSRLPVYENDRDNVIGMLYAKDLLRHVASKKDPVPIRELMRDCTFVLETNTLDEVLAMLQDKRVHLAMVVDEYGGTSGLVTMEDLLEEIVGEIFDEYDLRREAIRVLEPGIALVDARVHVDDVNEALDTKIPEDEVFETIGGYVHHELGHLATDGEMFEADGVRVKVEKVANRRILRVRIERLEPVDDDAAAD